MKFSVLLVNGSVDSDGATPVTQLHSNEKLVPYADDPLPFFLKYSEEADSIQSLKPWLRIMAALNSQLSIMGHQGFAQALAAAMASAVEELWPHHKQVYAIMNSKRAGCKIITPTRVTLDPYVGGKSSAVFVFPSMTHMIIWVIAGGNRNLKDWGLHQWTAISVQDRDSLQGIASSVRHTRPEPICISSWEDDESGDKMDVDLKPAVKGKTRAEFPLPPSSVTSTSVPNGGSSPPSTTPSSVSAATPHAPRGPPPHTPGSRNPGPPAAAHIKRTDVSVPRPPTSTPARPQPSTPTHARARARFPARIRSLSPPGVSEPIGLPPRQPIVPPKILRAIEFPATRYTVRFIPKKPAPTLNLTLIRVSDTAAVEEYQRTAAYLASTLNASTQFYLLCHGWTSSDMIITIQAAIKLRAKHTQFVKLLTEAGMPATQAEFFYHFIKGDELMVDLEEDD